MEVKLIDHMGTDLSVVNSARVSFAKESEGYQITDHKVGTKELPTADRKLIVYLAKHKHNTPFMHNSITLHMKVPLFVGRQIHKHQVGFTVNEVSRRYVDEDPTFYTPSKWRQRAKNVKQGSSDKKVVGMCQVGLNYTYATTMALQGYKDMLSSGVCPEQARMVLPQSMYTEFYMTGSLYGWAQLFLQRTDDHAQKEIRDVAYKIGDIIAQLFPFSWPCLVNEELTK